MEYSAKAILDTVVGANANREDLTNTLYLTDGPARPIVQSAPHVPATNTTHQWREIGLNVAGRTNVAGGGATYAESGLPNAAQKTPARLTNETCNVGRLAQVSDNEMAAFNGGNSVNLAQGEMERLIQNAMDVAAALVGIEVMNQIEWIMVSGDASQTTMEGGEADGLVKWVTAGGYVVGTGGTTGAPVNMTEQFLKDAGRGVAKTYPTLHFDTFLVPPELIPDINSYIADGAGRPLVVVASGDNSGLVGGHQVGVYNDGYAAIKIEMEPYLSPAYNSSIAQCAIIGYRKSQVKIADLIPFGANPLAKTDTTIKRLVNWVGTQEHSVAKHTAIIPNVQSAIP